jgi:hypothetical protein
VQAKLHGEVAALDRLLANDYIGINSVGSGTRKERRVAGFQNFSVHVAGEWRLFSVVQTFRVESDTLKVVGLGSKAVHPVTGRLHTGMMGMK